MNVPDDLVYTKDHEWLRVEGECVVVGITEFAQSELGEIVFCDLPASGKSCKRGESLCVVESTKAASDVYAPVNGSVRESNGALADSPALINTDPYGEGWMVKLEGIASAELSGMLTPAQYRELLSGK